MCYNNFCYYKVTCILDKLGMQGNYQGPGGYNQYPNSNDQYSQHYPPANAPVSYPSGPVRPSLYPPYSNEAER